VISRCFKNYAIAPTTLSVVKANCSISGRLITYPPIVKSVAPINNFEVS
jgi:hypothetical protein